MKLVFPTCMGRVISWGTTEVGLATKGLLFENERIAIVLRKMVSRVANFGWKAQAIVPQPENSIRLLCYHGWTSKNENRQTKSWCCGLRIQRKHAALRNG